MAHGAGAGTTDYPASVAMGDAAASGYPVGPMIALSMIVVMVLLLAVLVKVGLRRDWGRVATTAENTDPPDDDYGLLAVAAVVRTDLDADLIRAHLRSAGIRSTLAPDQDGRLQVLVFADELDRARRVVG